jgi:hypothetical protein
LEHWFYNLTEVVSIGYHKQSEFLENYKFRVEFQSGQVLKWIEGYTNLNDMSGYYIRISDQAFVYQINLASWQLLTLNLYSFLSRYPLKHHKKDKLIFENIKIDQSIIRSLHTLFLSEPAQSLSMDRPKFKKQFLINLVEDNAEILIDDDKIIMHWLDSPLYYFYQNKELASSLGKYK